MNQNLLKMIALLKSHEVSIRLSTSLAFPLSKQFLEKFILSGINYLIITITGMSSKTSETYRIGGDFHLAMSNLSPYCGRYPGDPNWGRLEKGAFYQIWNNAHYEKARISLTEFHGRKRTENYLCQLPASGNTA